MLEAIARADLKEEQSEALTLIRKLVQDKAEHALAPISAAHYGAIHCYYKSNELLMHAGANIDPSSIELLKSRKHRKCAEKEAAKSAASIDSLDNPELKIMFLYRKDNSGMPAQKLVPCSDCYQNFIASLIKNDGKLVLILDDDAPREFVDNKNYDNSISKLGETYYKILDTKALMNLNIEESLGARVCTEKQS
ncbi:MAG: hypothetical protein OXU45_01910 [Candidatus Melainabacteria bacterium]|nr:hypothetical protein [Candidatus Melainabacteria bacterium]